MLKKYEIRGLRVEKYIQKVNDIDYIENERYIFNCIEDSRNYEILLYFKYISRKEKTTVFEIKEVKHFIGTSYLPLNIFSIMIDVDNKEHYNEAFDFNNTDINIKYEKFRVTNRLKKSRPVWIIRGESGLGKSYLTTTLFNNSNLTIYETDSSPNLPLIIFEDIIVIGNKYNFNIKQIEERIFGEHETIIVKFDKFDLKF